MHSSLKVFPAPCLWISLGRQVVANDGSTEVRMVDLAVDLSAFVEEDAGPSIVKCWKLPEEAHVNRHQC